MIWQCQVFNKAGQFLTCYYTNSENNLNDSQEIFLGLLAVIVAQHVSEYTTIDIWSATVRPHPPNNNVHVSTNVLQQSFLLKFSFSVRCPCYFGTRYTSLYLGNRHISSSLGDLPRRPRPPLHMHYSVGGIQCSSCSVNSHRSAECRFQMAFHVWAIWFWKAIVKLAAAQCPDISSANVWLTWLFSMPF